MEEETSKRSWVGCLLQALVALVLLVVVGCVGTCGGTWLAFFWGIHPAAPPAERPLVIRGGTLFTGGEGAPKTGWLVVVDDGVVRCAGPDCGAPAHAEVVEARGTFITPGLIDLHVHFGAPAGPEMARSFPVQIWSFLRHRPHVRRAFLEAGFTTIRSVGDDLQTLTNQQVWLADGTIGGPALVRAGPVFTAPGGHPADKLLAEAPHLVAGSTRQVSDPDAARTRVRELLDQGVDGIKLVYDDVGGTLPKLDRAVLEAAVAEARGAGVWVAVHTGTDQDVRDALAAGATTIEHGARDHLSEATLEALREADAVYIPTLAVVEALLPELQGRAMGNALRVHQAGVRVGVGSDTQGPTMDFGTSSVREILLLVQAGLPVLDALRGATGHGGHALGRPEELGVIAEGARADLVLFDGDPREDPLALTRPVLVIQRGRVVHDAR